MEAFWSIPGSTSIAFWTDAGKMLAMTILAGLPHQVGKESTPEMGGEEKKNLQKCNGRRLTKIKVTAGSLLQQTRRQIKHEWPLDAKTQGSPRRKLEERY